MGQRFPKPTNRGFESHRGNMNNHIDWARESRMAGGRICVYAPGHPGANNRGYALRSRLVMEESLGRILSPDEHVHHVNGDELDDRIENLSVMSRSEHALAHYGQGDGLALAMEGRRVVDGPTLKGLREQGLGYKRISRTTGWSRTTVRDACHRLGI